jgi:fatty-acyl-CoA synthase
MTPMSGLQRTEQVRGHVGNVGEAPVTSGASMRPKKPSVPAPGQAPLVAPNAAALLRANASDPDIGPRPAIRFGMRVWSHREYLVESARFANLFLERLPAGAPPHVAVLLDNTPDYLFAFGGAALIGGAVVGLNHTRRGEHLLRDAEHTHCGLVITEPRHEALLAPIAGGLPPILTSTRFADAEDPQPTLGSSLAAALDGVTDDDPGTEPDLDAIWALIFTSGTSDAPKAVICSQRRLLVTGKRLSIIMDVDADDVGYVCMPLFHSNAIQVGWAPSIVVGASVGLGRRFSTSRWLRDIRHYGATYFNYTGKPLAYLLAQPEQPDDADNPLRVAFGNEGSPEVVERFSRRFGVEVIDAYGATEGGIAVNRDAEERAGALGQAPENIKIVDEDGSEKAVAGFDADGRLINAEECVGEIVNTAGVGPFEGYYNNVEATEQTTRFGWYWSGDLGYLDADRYLYFAGRNADWIRVDGENFPAGPIEEALRDAPGVILAAVYGVPDDQAGDQVMAGLVLGDGESLDAPEFARWLDAQVAIGPKWRPRYLRVLRDPPTTGTNKIVKRTLVHEKFRPDRVGDDPLYVRDRGDDAYRPFGAGDAAALLESFRRYRRERFWDL